MRDDKMKAIEFYERQLRGLRLKVGAWIFKFNFQPHQFADENGISVQEGRKVFPAVRAEAQDKLTMTLGRARKAALEVHDSTLHYAGKTRTTWQLRFRTFLPTLEPILWNKIYKRVELCPMEQEIDA